MTVIAALRGALGADRVLTDETTLASRRHDYWMVSNLRDRQDRPAPRPPA